MTRTALVLLLLPMTANADALFDLHVGDTWHYETSGDPNDSVTNRISEIRTNAGATWYRLIEYGETYWVRNSESGQVEAIDYFETDLPEQPKAQESLIFKFPATPGDSWRTGETIIRYEGIEEIQVPAGTYKCHMYLFDMGADSSKTCIAKDIGVIYNEFRIGDEPPRISRLQSFAKGS